MNARIGAPCTVDANARGAEISQCFFQAVLHGLARALALPALVGLAVVADAQCQSHRSVSGFVFKSKSSAVISLGKL